MAAENDPVSQEPIPFQSPEILPKSSSGLPDEENDIAHLLENGSLSPRETQVIQKIADRAPFLEDLLKSIYPEKGMRLCGPAAVTLSRMLSFDFGIPIGQHIDGEHLEVCVGIFDPVHDPDELARIEEQSFLKYYSPEGNVYYCDLIYPSLLGKDETQMIAVEKYSPGSFDAELARRRNIFSITSYPISNLYYAKRQEWEAFFGAKNGKMDQEAGIADIREMFIQMQKVMNQVAYDELLIIFIDDERYFTNPIYFALQAISFTQEYDGLFRRMEQLHPDAPAEKEAAWERFYLAKENGRI